MAPPLRIALAQFQPRKGSYPANLARIRELFVQVANLTPRPDVLCLPETATSGYFVEGGVEDVAMPAGQLAADLDRAWRDVAPKDTTLDVVIGFYERWDHSLHNSALYLRVGVGDAGTILHVHRKLFLPTYGLFDEHRFVEPGLDVRAFDAPWGRTAVLVCEDAWHSITGTIAALDGAQVVFVCSAAPARGLEPADPGSLRPPSVTRWERLIRDIAEEHGVFAVLCNLVGSEGGKAFQGGSIVAGPHGDIRARAPVMEEALLVAELHLADIARARADMPLLSDLRAQLPNMERELARVRTGERANPPRFDAAPANATAHSPNLTSQVPSPKSQVAGPKSQVSSPESLKVISPPTHGTPPSLGIDPALAEKWLVTFIRDEMGRRGFTDAVIGLSGGVDSALTAALATRALGADHVHPIRMPYRTSSPDSLAHAQLVADAFGLKTRTVDISDAVDGYLKHEPDADATRRGNVMARNRMIVLFDLSAKLRALPLGTGNKTERLLGYFTWHADDSPPINPLGDLFKTQVWALARHMGIPAEVIAKPASADLVQGQTDESDFGISYARADEILNWLLNGFALADLVARGFTEAEIAIVRKRLDSTHWKRRVPTVAMLSGTAIGEGYLRPVDY